MEKLVFHQISDSTYVGMITILDYEISLKKCLLDITIPPEINKDKRIIVDLALKYWVKKWIGWFGEYIFEWKKRDCDEFNVIKRKEKRSISNVKSVKSWLY